LAVCARECPAGEAARAAAAAACRGGAPMNAAIAAGLLTLGQRDCGRLPAPLRERYTRAQTQALTLIPQVVELAACILGHELQWSDDASIEEMAFRALAGRTPSAAEARLLRATFISCIDHTPATPSSLAAITSYSGGNSLQTALAAGITAMGDTHAGAGEGTARLLSEYLAKMRQAVAAGGAFEADGVRVPDHKALAAYIVDKVTGVYGGEKGRIPGYGHRYYSLYGKDPRAVALLNLAGELGLAGEHCLLAGEIEAVLKEKKAQGLCFNVDGVIGALLCDLRMRPEAGKAMFIIPRTVGILGQLLEQDPGSFFRLQNDSIIYVGPELRR
ncbi:MAG: citrate/2-methylcitrate synthase, partial [Planctomycetota bacterium]